MWPGNPGLSLTARPAERIVHPGRPSRPRSSGSLRLRDCEDAGFPLLTREIIRSANVARWVQDVDIERKLIHIRQGKGRKDNYTLLSEFALQALKAYLETEGPQTWLFTRPYQADRGPGWRGPHAPSA